ncbi:MAG: bifunctional DNA primase/polymerase, partial [Candidatus Paceibacterota bacterium]
MDNKQKMIELALSYLKKGWSVIPCHKSKIPAIPWRDFQTRYATPEEVVSWYETNPDAQVGIVTGKISNLTVVDVEDHGDPSFLPQETMIVHTGGNGYHYFFKYEPGVTNKARIKELVDIRSEGGYVVAPGSCSEKGAYVILQDVPLLSFPKELFPEKVDIFQYPGITAKGFTKKELDYYPGYGKGQRNDEMARYIGYILTQIHPADWDTEGWDITLKANQKNTPPLTPNELRNTFESIKRTERRKNPLGRSMTLLEPSRGMPEEDDITVLGDENDEVIHLAEAAALQELDDSQTFPLDMPCFDEAIGGGINIGDVIAIAGQTGHGKTTLAQDWTLSLLKGEGKLKPLWFSYEVLPVHLWKKFQEMGANREDCVFTPLKHSTGSVSWIEQKIQEGKNKFGIKAVFIDHLGFLLTKTNGVLGKNMGANYATFLTQI